METNKSVPMTILPLLGALNAVNDCVRLATPENAIHMKAAAYDVLVEALKSFLEKELNDE